MEGGSKPQVLPRMPAQLCCCSSTRQTWRRVLRGSPTVERMCGWLPRSGSRHSAAHQHNGNQAVGEEGGPAAPQHHVRVRILHAAALGHVVQSGRAAAAMPGPGAEKPRRPQESQAATRALQAAHDTAGSRRSHCPARVHAAPTLQASASMRGASAGRNSQCRSPGLPARRPAK